MRFAPNTIYASFSMDFTIPIHWAMRTDGQWFKRLRVKDVRFGWKNTAWQPVPAECVPDTISTTYGNLKARLPKAGAL